MNCFLLQFLAGFDGFFKLVEVVFYLPDIYWFHNRKLRRWFEQSKHSCWFSFIFIGKCYAKMKGKLQKTPRWRGFGWKTGLEPATSGSTNQRSNQLSYNHRVGFQLSDFLELVCKSKDCLSIEQDWRHLFVWKIRGALSISSCNYPT